MPAVVQAIATVVDVWLVSLVTAAVTSLLRMSPPGVPLYARSRAMGNGTGQLRRDFNAGFMHDHRGFLFCKRSYFVGTGCPPLRVATQKLAQLKMEQIDKPVALVSSSSRTWWWFEGKFYWDSSGYTSLDVLALVRDRERRERTKLENAHVMLRVEQSPKPRRKAIPRAMRRVVFERDGGQCTQCGATFDIQYDHVIPVSRGGATTVENLQILCGTCNRDKSANL